MQNEKLSDRHSPISFDLEEEIKNTDGNILLFLNKKKESGHLFCKSCKTSQHLEKQPATCPYCQSPDIFWNVLNIETLSKETEKLFPGKKIDIFTAQVLYAPIAKKYTLIAHIQPDSLLYLTDYASAEKLYAQTIQLKKLLTPQGRLILQTYNPEHHVFSVIETGDYSTFYKSELKERKLMSYPPYSILCKFTVKNKSVERAKDIAEVLVFQMDSQNSQNLKILGPYKSLFWKKTPSYHIIAKYPVSNYLIEERFRKIQEIKKMIKTDKSFQIEVDPISIQ